MICPDSTRWDVAIVFATEDEAIAFALRSHLQPHHTVYLSRIGVPPAFSSPAQAADVLLSRSTLLVLLPSERWGEAPAVACEEAAIVQRFTRADVEELMVVNVTSTTASDAWIPDAATRIEYEQTGVLGIARAIEWRLASLTVRAMNLNFSAE